MSNKQVISQNDAVFLALCNVLGDREQPFDAGMNAKEVVTEADREAIIGVVTQGIMAGEVFMKETSRVKYDTESKTRGYVRGMVDNHFKKDRRMNGDVKHAPKNPGSRTGNQDETIKNLKGLKTKTDDPEALAKIDAAIAARIAELKAAKAPAVTVDPTKIPANLHYLLNNK